MVIVFFLMFLVLNVSCFEGFIRDEGHMVKDD